MNSEKTICYKEEDGDSLCPITDIKFVKAEDISDYPPDYTFLELIDERFGADNDILLGYSKMH